ncbi:hypothetical protein IE81DRAFT_341966 [Ceraceosorus guamensis]|uniref:Uncharacterized protein n=1 Tax=Ceraceosorus guamensis TaxID=1522189 RepID=A0A316VVZ7_9BASI|nr:hypothetical protein IE81DRAFT_341966 [Ceraceosorus guamensis]PWN41639.1 hypothetical protein IE81DRAFT_341966 [Ceraceosorus guamensis]
MPLTRSAAAAAGQSLTVPGLQMKEWVNKKEKEGLSQKDLPDLLRHRDAVIDSMRHLWVKTEKQDAEAEQLRKEIAHLQAQLAEANVAAAATALTQIRVEDTAGGSEESGVSNNGGAEDSEEAEVKGSVEAVTESSVEESSVEKSSVEKSSVEESSVEKSSVEESSVEKSSVEESSVEVEAPETAEAPEAPEETETGEGDSSAVPQEESNSASASAPETSSEVGNSYEFARRFWGDEVLGIWPSSSSSA